MDLKALCSSLASMKITKNNSKDVHNELYKYLQVSKEARDKIEETKNVSQKRLTKRDTVPQSQSTTPSQSPEILAGPVMVIHVCDEAKNLKQDFTCPRDLLVQEMKYFAEYLSVESHRLEEVDISVHCDIHIFDWLMRYVKRENRSSDQTTAPKLDPNNVISILISSDFLKMETLVDECITYCHDNMSLIVATPCNMNCVNERLTSLISARFNHTELDQVKDRKDKFRSKLYFKKLEKLFDKSATGEDCAGKAVNLFRCSVCQRIMTKEQSSLLPCTNNRLFIDVNGGLTYKHEVDAGWDVSVFLIKLFEQLKKWNLVYWRVWGIINHLECSRCKNVFQVGDYEQCVGHAERAQYHQISHEGTNIDNPVGIYPCCNQHVLRFDPTGVRKGCIAKEHIITSSNPTHRLCMDELLAHKAMCKIPRQVNPSSSDLNVYLNEEIICGVKESTSTPMELINPVVMQVIKATVPVPSAHKKSKVKIQRSSSDEDSADEEEETPHIPNFYSQPSMISRNLPPLCGSNPEGENNAAKNTQKKAKEKVGPPRDQTPYNKYPCKKRWDTARSIRWNQDTQREDDWQRFQSITQDLAKRRTPDKPLKVKAKEARELHGGIFTKLETAFFNNLRLGYLNPAQTHGKYAPPTNFKDYKTRMKNTGR